MGRRWVQTRGGIEPYRVPGHPDHDLYRALLERREEILEHKRELVAHADATMRRTRKLRQAMKNLRELEVNMARLNMIEEVEEAEEGYALAQQELASRLEDLRDTSTMLRQVEGELSLLSRTLAGLRRNNLR